MESLGIASTTSTQIRGAARPLYYRRPVMPSLQALPASVVLAPTAVVDPLQPPVIREVARARTIAIQTDYRESEAQTDPYSPDYVVSGGTEPEILSLTSLKFGQGLPAGPAELEKIDRIRRKREMERALPPGTDDAAFALRKRMLEEIEGQQWKDREDDIAALHDHKLNQLGAALVSREDEQASAREARLEKLRRQRALHLDDQLSTISRKRVQVLRKTADGRRGVPTIGDRKKKDIVSEYSNFASKVYAPIAREGIRPDTRAPAYEDVTAHYTSTTRGLFSLAESLPHYSMNLKSTARSIASRARDASILGPKGSGRAMRQAAADLERVAAKLESDGQPTKPLPPPRSRHPVERPIERPETPETVPAAQEDTMEQAALFLQRLLRGRAAQNSMFMGKERRTELLDELRAAAQVPPPPPERGHRDAAIAAVLDGVAGAIIGQTLAVLAQQKVRGASQQQLTALMHQAETQRRAREAEEAGTRQREIREHAQREEEFRQMQRQRQTTSASLVDDAMSAAVESLAPGSVPEPTREAGVDEVMGYLLPRVADDASQKQKDVEDARYSEAASKVLRDEATNTNPL